MGYSELDYRLMDAFYKVRAAAREDPDVAAAVCRRAMCKTLDKPLRSWALVLRASDSRMPDTNTQGIVEVTPANIRRWCGNVVIDKPGVSIDQAAQMLGVNRTTVSRWATPEGAKSWKAALDKQDAKEAAAAEHDPVLARCRERFGTPTTRTLHGRRLELSYTINRAHRKRDLVRVWTPGYGGIDPGGETWPGYWEDARVGLAGKVAEDFSQQLVRIDRRLSARTRVWQWVCPAEQGGCGRLVYKVYLAMPMWTLVSVLGFGIAERASSRGESFESDLRHQASKTTRAEARSAGGGSEAFLCLRCAGLVYESSERTSVPGRRRDGSRRYVDVWDRFVKRVSGGALKGSMV